MPETSDKNSQSVGAEKDRLQADEDVLHWVHDATPAQSLYQGVRRGMREPGIILAITAMGFGALAHEAGISIGNTMAMMLIFFALPAQVILIDNVSRGASLLATAFAVTLTGVRLLPMTVVLMPYLRSRRYGIFYRIFAVHFIAVTAWVEGMRWIPKLPETLRMTFFLGLGSSLLVATTVGVALGHGVAANLPVEIARVMPFLTPIYFLVSMLAATRSLSDYFPILAGLVLGPLFHLVLPELDLLLAGVVGGTLAYFCAKRFANG